MVARYFRFCEIMFGKGAQHFRGDLPADCAIKHYFPSGSLQAISRSVRIHIHKILLELTTHISTIFGLARQRVISQTSEQKIA